MRLMRIELCMAFEDHVGRTVEGVIARLIEHAVELDAEVVFDVVGEQQDFACPDIDDAYLKQATENVEKWQAIAREKLNTMVEAARTRRSQQQN